MVPEDILALLPNLPQIRHQLIGTVEWGESTYYAVFQEDDLMGGVAIFERLGEALTLIIADSWVFPLPVNVPIGANDALEALVGGWIRRLPRPSESADDPDPLQPMLPPSTGPTPEQWIDRSSPLRP